MTSGAGKTLNLMHDEFARIWPPATTGASVQDEKYNVRASEVAKHLDHGHVLQSCRRNQEVLVVIVVHDFIAAASWG